MTVVTVIETGIVIVDVVVGCATVKETEVQGDGPQPTATVDHKTEALPEELSLHDEVPLHVAIHALHPGDDILALALRLPVADTAHPTVVLHPQNVSDLEIILLQPAHDLDPRIKGDIPGKDPPALLNNQLNLLPGRQFHKPNLPNPLQLLC